MTEPRTEAGRRLRYRVEMLADSANVWIDSESDAPYMDVTEALILSIEAEVCAEVRAALEDAFQTMDAACRWAANETAGVKTIADANRHMAGFDALVDGTARTQAVLALLAAGVTFTATPKDGWSLTHACNGEQRTLTRSGIAYRCPACGEWCDLIPIGGNVQRRDVR